MNFTKITLNATLALSLALSASPIGSLAATPSDIKGYWAEGDINTMIDKGLIGGYEDGTFKPNNSITRAEFAAILRRSLGLEILEGSAFTDTNKFWAKSEINTLYKNGIITKEDYGQSFGPNKEISRLEISRMVARTLVKEGFTIDALDYPDLTDIQNLESMDLQSIIFVNKYRIIGGMPNKTFQPNEKATRGQAAKILNKMLQVRGEKPQPPVEVPKPKTVENSKLSKDILLDVPYTSPKTAQEVEANIESMPLNNFSGDINSKYKVADIGTVVTNFSEVPYVAGAIRMKLPADDMKIVADPVSGYNFLMAPVLGNNGFDKAGSLIKDGKIIDFVGAMGKGSGKYGVGKIDTGTIYEADYIAFNRNGSGINDSFGDDAVLVMIENPFKK